MIVPKLMVACLSSIVPSFSLPVFIPVFEDFTYFQNIFLYVFYASPIIFTYGIMTFIFSEFLSQRMTFKIKKITSFLMHLMFGAFSFSLTALYSICQYLQKESLILQL